MNTKENDSKKPGDGEARRFGARDALTAQLLGWFFVVLAAPVLVGCFLEEKRVDILISLGAGVALLMAGAGFIGWGWRVHRFSHTRWTEK